MRLIEMDAAVTYAAQLHEDGDGPVVLVNPFTVDAADVERFLEVWTADAEFMAGRSGFVSTQLHRGTAGSTTFLNVAHWSSPGALRAAFTSPEFRARLADYPESATASPHLFRRVAVPGICGG